MLFAPTLLLAHCQAAQNQPCNPRPGKEPKPGTQAKNPARKNRPKLYLHKTSYMSSHTSAPQKPKLSYNWVLCKIAARPARTKGKKAFPFHPFRAVPFASRCPRSRQKTLLGVPADTQGHPMAQFSLCPSLRSSKGIASGRWALRLFLIGGSSTPKPPDHFFESQKPHKATALPKLLPFKKTFAFFFSTEKIKSLSWRGISKKWAAQS